MRTILSRAKRVPQHRRGRIPLERLERRALLDATVVDDPSHVTFDRVVVDPAIVANGHKPKAMGDIDGDGLTDIVAYTLGQGLYWYKYPTWTKYPIWLGGDSSYEDAQSADIDNDGDTDVIIADRWFQNPLVEGGNPAAGPWVQHMIGTDEHHDVEIGDINLDGKIDLATITGIFLQNSADSWTLIPASQFPDRGSHGTALGDVDNDGDLDMLAPSASTPNQLLWWENPTIGSKGPITGTWTKRVITPAYPRTSSVVVDMDEDGRNDVVMAPDEDSSGPLIWLKAPPDPKANGAVWTVTQIDPQVADVHTGSIEVADYNLDGHLDLFLPEQEQSPLDRLVIFYGDGTGTHFVRQIFGPPGGGHNPKTGDIDGDGDVDILNANHGFYGAPDPVDLWRNRLDPVAMPTVTLVASDRTASESAGDSGKFTFARSGSTVQALTVRYSISGQAANGVDYDSIGPTVTFPPGASTVDVKIQPIDDIDLEGIEPVVLTVRPDPSYSIITGARATVVIADNDSAGASGAYLSDLNPTFVTNGWGPYERDRSNGEQGAADGHMITLNGVTFAKGLGVHAASEQRYALGGNYTAFRASVGVDDEVGSNGSVVFQVWVDGIKQFDSGVMTGTTATKPVDVNVAGHSELKLIVTDGGNGNGNDHADWADARLVVPPAVLGSQFVFNTGPPRWRVRFNSDVSQSLSSADVAILNLTTGTPVPAGTISLVYDSLTQIATVTFPGVASGILPDGDYRVSIAAADVTNSDNLPMSADSISTFFVLAGDANRDRVVDVSDLNIVATNWLASGRDFEHGDFNYDGVVDSIDLGILSINWQTSLGSPPQIAKDSGGSLKGGTVIRRSTALG